MEGGRNLLVCASHSTPSRLRLMAVRTLLGQHGHLRGECRSLDVRPVFMTASKSSLCYALIRDLKCQLLGHPVSHMVPHRVHTRDDLLWHLPGGHWDHVHAHHGACRPWLGTRNQDRDGEHVLCQRDLRAGREPRSPPQWGSWTASGDLAHYTWEGRQERWRRRGAGFGCGHQ